MSLYKGMDAKTLEARYDVPGADHMGELDHLADDGSVFFAKSMQLIMSTS